MNDVFCLQDEGFLHACISRKYYIFFKCAKRLFVYGELNTHLWG
jgi:uncharacterized protein (UPF0332 family)